METANEGSSILDVSVVAGQYSSADTVRYYGV